MINQRFPFVLLAFGVASFWAAGRPSVAAAAEAPVAVTTVTLAALDFEGNHAMSGDLIRRALPLKEGDVFLGGDGQTVERSVEAFYRRQGYLEATAASTVTVSGTQARVLTGIHEGPLYRFGPTRIIGLRTLSAPLIHFRFAYKEGDPYVRRKLLDTQTELVTSGFFDDVRIDASTTPAHTADVLVRVTERRLKWIKGGVGWGSEEHQRLTLSLEDQNFLRRGYHTTVYGTLSAIWLEYGLTFVNPYLFGTKTEHRISSSWRREHRKGYDYERTRAETSVGRNLFWNTKGSVTLGVDRNVVYNVNSQIAQTTPDRSDSRSATFALNRDTANDLFFPTAGTRTGLSYQRSGGFFGGTIDFNKVTLDTVRYQHLGGPWVLAGAVRAGLVEEFGASQEVPIFDRFFMGGANSVRGYAERQLGPKAADGSPLGGKYRFGSSLELRFPLFWKLRGATFIDGGQVGPTASEAGVQHWRYGAGLGVRLVTPVGPFRLDYGRKLNRESSAESMNHFHFSLGEAF